MISTAAVDRAVLSVFGEEVKALYTPLAGVQVGVDGFFQLPDEIVDTLSLDPEENRPQIRTHVEDTPNPQHGDLWEIRGDVYETKQVEVDEATMIVNYLEQQ